MQHLFALWLSGLPYALPFLILIAYYVAYQYQNRKGNQ